MFPLPVFRIETLGTLNPPPSNPFCSPHTHSTGKFWFPCIQLTKRESHHPGSLLSVHWTLHALAQDMGDTDVKRADVWIRHYIWDSFWSWCNLESFWWGFSWKHVTVLNVLWFVIQMHRLPSRSPVGWHATGNFPGTLNPRIPHSLEWKHCFENPHLCFCSRFKDVCTVNLGQAFLKGLL